MAGEPDPPVVELEPLVPPDDDPDGVVGDDGVRLLTLLVGAGVVGALAAGLLVLLGADDVTLVFGVEDAEDGATTS